MSFNLFNISSWRGVNGGIILLLIDSNIGDFYGTTEAIKMRFGMRTPSIKKSIKARTTGKAKRAIKKAVIPGYGKNGIGWIKNPKKAAYNKVYKKTSFGIMDLFK